MAMRYPGGLIATSPVNAAYPSGVWTQTQTTPYVTQNVWQNDQYWPYTTLLLHGDGTNGAQNNTFLDSGTANSGSGFTITRNGNTTQGAFTPFQQNGYWSNYFDGTGDYLSVADNAALEIGASSFSIEAWIYLDALPSSGTSQVILSKWVSGNYSYIFQVNNNSGTMRFSFSYSTDGSSGTDLFQNAPINAGTWQHVAITRNSTTVRFFLNGVQQGSTQTANATFYNGTAAVEVGRNGDNASLFKGYISNCRLVVGSAVYTADFTPSTAPLTAITNTSLLTCQSNRFKDNSTNNFTLTRNGDTSVQAFQPFPGPTTWSASVLGGSGYFDGSGDYLSVADNAAFTLGSGDFTIECWAYWTGSGQQRIIAQADSGGNNVSFVLGTTSANKAIGRVLVSTTAYDATSSADLVVNQWNHIAFVRNGSTLRLYINGVQDGTNGTISTQSVFDSSYQIGIGRPGELNAEYFKGYVSSLRFVKGTCVYPSGTTFTPPTSPLTNITNTSLLLNFTNAGIFDNAQMNDLETVGNAQVSTSVVKYGTGSMAFDGSGDYCVTSPSAVNDLSTGNWTIEFWVYPTTAASQQTLVNLGTSASNPNGTNIWMNTSRQLVVDNTLTSQSAFSGGTLTLNTWNHVAITRVSTTTTGYINGVSVGTNSYTPNANQVVCLGYLIANGYAFNGYIDDLRITKGVARYISNFTPPIARMPNQ